MHKSATSPNAKQLAKELAAVLAGGTPHLIALPPAERQAKVAADLEQVLQNVGIGTGKQSLDSAALNEKQAAAYIGMSVPYLRCDRMNGHREGRTPGPPYIRIGRTIRYLREDLDDWLAKHRVVQQPVEED